MIFSVARAWVFATCILVSACSNSVSPPKSNGGASLYVDEREGVALAFKGSEGTSGDTDTVRALLKSGHRMGQFKTAHGKDSTCVIFGYNALGVPEKIAVGGDFSCGGARFVVQQCLLSDSNGQPSRCSRYLIMSGCGDCFGPLSREEWEKRISTVLNIQYVYDVSRGVTEIILNEPGGSKHMMLTSDVGLFGDRI